MSRDWNWLVMANGHVVDSADTTLVLDLDQVKVSTDLIWLRRVQGQAILAGFPGKYVRLIAERIRTLEGDA